MKPRSAGHLHVRPQNPDMADLRAYVANCLMGGHSITQTADSWTRDTVEFSCAGQEFRFVQNAGVVGGQWQQLTGSFSETSEVLVYGVNAIEVTKSLEVIDRICWLLSLAGLSRVVRYGHDYPDGSSLGSRQSSSGTANYFRPTIDIRDGVAVKSFIEQVYPNYARLENVRKLNVVIDYLAQAERQNQSMELKLILLFVVLENLKDTYARARGIPYIKGFFRKQPRPNGQKFGFEELLQMMFREVRLRTGLKRVVRLRNEIIHSGLSRHPHGVQWAMYEIIFGLIQKYLLRTIGYTGLYLPYSLGGNAHVAV